MGQKRRRPLKETDINSQIPPVISKPKKKKLTVAKVKISVHELPDLPAFSPPPREILSTHERCALFFNTVSTTPFEIFSAFFTPQHLEIIVDNSNAYALQKVGRKWKSITVIELQVFLALVIMMGLYVYPSVRDYWKTDRRLPLMNNMSLDRFEDIKRYLHLSPPISQLESSSRTFEWWMKLEPLASWVRQQSKKLYLPASQVAVDEMMVRFGGRSKHTVKMPNKPISEGYKIFALCDRGYTYDFTFYSPHTGYSYITKQPSSDLTPTGDMVYALATSLPYKQYRFDIYMDNFFTSIPLLRALLHQDIGAIGTARQTSAEFPASLNINKDEVRKSLPWNHLCGDIVDNNILVLLWQDNNAVILMSTIHDPTSYTVVRRRKPRATSTNATKAREPFGPTHELNLPIPSIIDDYNQYMNGVDIADHLRSNYCTQLTSHRTWVPLFYWLLDTVIINSYRIYQQTYP